MKTYAAKFLLITAIIFGSNVIFLSPVFAYDQVLYKAQQLLTEKGYEPGPVDGLAGNRTTDALREFQKANSLPVTGKLDERTRHILGISSDEGQTKQAGTDKKAAYSKLKCVVGNGFGQIMGLGIFIEVHVNGTSKTFIFDQDLARKHKLIIEKEGGLYLVNGLKDKKVEISYESEQKEKYGHRYYSVVDVRELE